MVKTISPSIPQGEFGGGVRGVKHSKAWKIVQTAGPTGTKFGTRLRIHLEMDVYYMLKTISPSIPQGALGLPNGWTG